MLDEQSIRTQKLLISNQKHSAFIQHLKIENKVRLRYIVKYKFAMKIRVFETHIAFVKQAMMKEIKRQDMLIQKLNSVVNHYVTGGLLNHEQRK